MRISPQCLTALHTIQDNPGISATDFAALNWPHLVRGLGRMNPELKAAQYLRLLWRKKLLKRKYSSDLFEPGSERPRAIYFLSEFGFEVVIENEDRNCRCGAR